jgi:hypothetical protein
MAEPLCKLTANSQRLKSNTPLMLILVKSFNHFLFFAKLDHAITSAYIIDLPEHSLPGTAAGG